MKRLLLVVIGVLVLATNTAAQTPAQSPSVVNGTLDVQPLTGALDRELDALVARTSDPLWVGYAVATNGRSDDGGCWSSRDGFPVRRVGPVKLEGNDTLYVLYRIADRRVDGIRFSSPDCPLDAGGLTVRWLTGVSATASIDWLTQRFTAGDSARRLQNQAVVAIALHADPPALDRLLSLARDGKNAQLRGDALFWVAQRAGAKAMAAVTNAIDNDPDTEVKKKAVFALSQMPKDEGVPKMIEVARTNRNPEVRRQAMFWLGQSGDSRALKFFEDILRQ